MKFRNKFALIFYYEHFITKDNKDRKIFLSKINEDENLSTIFKKMYQ